MFIRNTRVVTLKEKITWDLKNQSLLYQLAQPDFLYKKGLRLLIFLRFPKATFFWGATLINSRKNSQGYVYFGGYYYSVPKST